jgi:hypothetical protein
MSSVETSPSGFMKNVPSFKNTSSGVIVNIIIAVIIVFAIGVRMYYYYRSKNPSKDVDDNYGEVNSQLTSVNSNNSDFAYSLRDYYIKTAYNCCSGGDYKNDYVSTGVLKDVIKQGVRCLDFEIYSINNNPVVATSTSDSYYVKETFNSVKFSDVMSVIINYAFSDATCPNPHDPLIIHLRIKSTNQKMYENLASIFSSESIVNKLLGKDYSYEYSYDNSRHNIGEVPLLELKDKILLIVDKSNPAFMECKNLYEYVNMTSNSMFARVLHYYDVQYSPDLQELIEFNKKCMTVVIPDKGTNPPNPSAISARETGSQMIAMRYQYNDDNLQTNESLFNASGSAFTLKPERLRYIQETIPDPPKQDPALSYATRTVSSDYYSFNI